MALKRLLRLRKPSEFKSVYNDGKIARGKLLGLFFKPNGLSCNRTGCSIPGKKVKSSVHRNRLRRLISESCMKNSEIISGYDLVWVIQHSVPVSVSFKEVDEEVAGLLKRVE